MQWSVGQSVSWSYTPRGYYGFSYPVNGEVVKVGPKRILIRVARKSDELVDRWVDPANLRERAAR